MRSIKVFGLALVAAFALSAVVASAAFATYDSEAETTTLNGVQVEAEINEFVTDVGTVKCTEATFTGTQKGAKAEGGLFTAATLKVTPKYAKCTLAKQAVTIATTGCEYEFATAVAKEAKVTVVCAAGKEIIIKDTAGLECEVKVGGQKTGGSVAFTNEGGKVKVKAAVTGISYKWTAGCPNAGKKAGENTNGTYKGGVSVSGEAGGKAVGIQVT